MSCSELTNRHLAVCLIPMVRDSQEEIERVSRVLRTAMIAAMTDRYGADSVEERTWPTKRDVMHECGMHSPTAVIKALQCYVYQASDMDGWSMSDAKREYETLMSRAIARLPEYEAAPWCIT